MLDLFLADSGFGLKLANGLIWVFFLGLSLLLILTILIQKPQGGGLAGAFGSGAGSGQTAFGAKTGDMLTIMTVSIFVIWLLGAIALNYWLKPASAATTPPTAVAPGTQQPAGAPAPGATPPAGTTPAPATGTTPPTTPPAGTQPAPAPATNPSTTPPSTPPASGTAPGAQPTTPPAPAPAPVGGEPKPATPPASGPGR